MTPPAEQHPLLAQARLAIASLPDGDLWARVVDSDGVLRQPGARIHRPVMLSQCRTTEWFIREYGDTPAMDLHWMAMEGQTSVWPVRVVRTVNNVVIISGPRGVLQLSVSRVSEPVRPGDADERSP